MRYAGAESYGAVCLGGRVSGGIDLVVDDFTDPPFTRQDMLDRNYKPGTLRWAMHQPVAKRIVFARPGTVRLWAPIQIINPLESMNLTFNETRQSVTIIGGIRLDVAGDIVWLNSRFRAALWKNAYRPFTGGPQATGDSLHISHPNNTLIINCEFSGGADEQLNIKAARGDSTIQDCVFCEGFINGNFGQIWGDENGHNFGGIFTSAAEGVGSIAFIRNAWLSLAKRMPTEVYSLPSAPRPKRTVIVNNLFYNWAAFCGSCESKEPTVLVGNHYQHGPNTPVSSLGYCSSAYIKDCAVKTPKGMFDVAVPNSAINPSIFKNYTAGNAPVTVLGTEVPSDVSAEIAITEPMERTASIESVLNNSGVFPLDNVSRSHRDAFRSETGWQGANPLYASGALDDYLNWATATA